MRSLLTLAALAVALIASPVLAAPVLMGDLKVTVAGRDSVILTPSLTLFLSLSLFFLYLLVLFQLPLLELVS